MADREESSLSEDSEGSSTSSSSEGLLQACSTEATPDNRDKEPSPSSSRPASRKKVRTLNSARLRGRREDPSAAVTRGGPSAVSSAKYGGQPKLPKPKLDLKALFDYLARKRELRSRNRRSPQTEKATKRKSPQTEKATKRKRPQREKATKRKSPEPRTKRPRLMASIGKRRKGYLPFAFVQKLYGQKHIPLRMECLFEQEALQGFFKYIEKLKFEHHLEKSLAKLDAAEDLEKETLESRRHKYLDDDGPLSPIEEANGDNMNEDCDTEDIGARIVDNSCFILSSKIPEKKSKRKTKS
ncbi:TATA box-binding protein-associated factor RNA polymerase I subunit D [Heteronotia binoei]|uniref:TATA box-binding protein-associated factor RNA polymerase I subunit D n=1 Tax=Heteronotia binoei TaxID=13085 RepID=UPI00292FFA9D|nr:TATA box-binding protein-associated factor RNA polymerase I subunit D [Heteronotia binoei]